MVFSRERVRGTGKTLLGPWRVEERGERWCGRGRKGREGEARKEKAEEKSSSSIKEFSFSGKNLSPCERISFA